MVIKGECRGWGRAGGPAEDAMQAEHLETRTLAGVKRRGELVIYLVGGRGNTGSIILLMKNWMLSDTLQHGWLYVCVCVCVCQRLLFQHHATRLMARKE